MCNLKLNSSFFVESELIIYGSRITAVTKQLSSIFTRLSALPQEAFSILSQSNRKIKKIFTQTKEGAEAMTETLTMRIDGEGITSIARDQTFNSNNFRFGMELLEGSLQTDQLTKNEIKGLAFAILDGRATIKGVYPDGDYRFEYLEEKDKRWDVATLIEKLDQKREKAEEELQELRQKYFFLAERLSDWEAREANREYKEMYEEDLFEDMEEETVHVLSSSLQSYINRMTDTKEHTTADYGWLDPNGTFYECEWGEHAKWADEWLEKHIPEEEQTFQLYEAGDILVDRGWVLLHNPSLGIAEVTKSELKELTKAQKEFLYDYFMERKCKAQADQIWKEGE